MGALGGCYTIFESGVKEEMQSEPRMYVEQDDGGYWIAGTNISLDSVVYAYKDGFSPEGIVKECFPSLSLEQVYGAIACYLANKSEVDLYLKGAESQFEMLRKSTREKEPEFYRKLADAKKRRHTHSNSE